MAADSNKLFPQGNEVIFQREQPTHSEEGKLGAVKSASVVTDTDTLWSLFRTVYDKANKKKQPEKRRDRVGLQLQKHTNITIF